MSFLNWLTDLPSKIVADVKTEINKLQDISTDVETKLESAATLADSLTNALKDFVTSPQGKTITEVISMVPGIGPYEQATLNFLPTLVQATGWAKAEFTKSPADIVVEGVTNAVNASLPDVKATNLIALNAHLNTLFTGLQGAKMSIQNSTTQASAVHAGVTPTTPLINNPDASTANVTAIPNQGS